VTFGCGVETGQVRQLKAAGCEKVFREKIAGTTADRPQLQKLMKALAPGDVVVTPTVDRLSRDTTDLLVIARDMQRAGAGIRSLAEPFLDTTSDFAEIIFAILGVAAKLERRRILERTARGRADANEKGVKFGRKPTLTLRQQKEAASASRPVRLSAAWRAATMSVRARSHACALNAALFDPPLRFCKGILNGTSNPIADKTACSPFRRRDEECTSKTKTTH
jgi:DNA invertase Pin-like site-specific DNA recombinase